MSFMNAISALASAATLARGVKKAPFAIPESALPAVPMKRIVLHWTAGSYVASALDREHYHFLIEGDGSVKVGLFSIKDNIPPLREGEYAAHTKGTNSNAIGVSICAMAEARQIPLFYGKYPLKELQWNRAAEVIALLCKRYGIEVSEKTVLTHAEVQPVLGIRQNGKWDISVLPFAKWITGRKAVGDDLRRRVKLAMV